MHTSNLKNKPLTKLPRSFFSRSTTQVAQDLIGKVLVFENFQGIITETEAYLGEEDPASHAARGKTPRNAVMFEAPGLSYVYFIYGMYHCLNIVTEKPGTPGAVLIRGLRLLNSQKHLDGPGKLCRELAITREHNGLDLVNHKHFYVTEGIELPFNVGPRVGIKVGVEIPWRFVAR